MPAFSFVPTERKVDVPLLTRRLPDQPPVRRGQARFVAATYGSMIETETLKKWWPGSESTISPGAKLDALSSKFDKTASDLRKSVWTHLKMQDITN